MQLEIMTTIDYCRSDVQGKRVAPFTLGVAQKIFQKCAAYSKMHRNAFKINKSINLHHLLNNFKSIVNDFRIFERCLNTYSGHFR